MAAYSPGQDIAFTPPRCTSCTALLQVGLCIGPPGAFQPEVGPGVAVSFSTFGLSAAQ